MTTLALALILLSGDPVAEAGVAYRQAQVELAAGKYEDAVQLLKRAVQLLGDESEQIKYRDDVSRRRHPYFPYYEWGRARLLQSQQEISIQIQRDHLAEAVGRLGQSRHPNASSVLEEAKARLAQVQKAIAMEGSFAAAKTRIELLGSGEKFEEAYKLLAAGKVDYPGRLKELAEVRMALLEKQKATLERYEEMMAGRLGDVVIMDPETAADRIIPLLKPALVPPEVIKTGGPRFQWLSRFIALWDRHSKSIARVGQAPGEQVTQSADALDAMAVEALVLKLPAGFRAASHLARAWRMGKLREIAAGNEDVVDTLTAGIVVRSGATAIKRSKDAVAGQEKSVKESLMNELNAREQNTQDLAKKIESVSKERERLTAPIVKAEELLANGDSVGDPVELEKLRSALSELESDGGFGTLTPRLRARAFFAHGITEAVLAFLEGKSPEQATERARLTVWRAFGFDPKVDERWKARVSPKLMALFDRIRPQ